MKMESKQSRLSRSAAAPCCALDLVRDVGGKDGLQPLCWSAAADPRMGGRHGASENRGELRGSKGKAVVPGHGQILPEEKKNAMRKIKLVILYALRKNIPAMKTLTQIKEAISANLKASREKFAGLQSHEIGTYNRSVMFGDEGQAFPSESEWSSIVD